MNSDTLPAGWRKVRLSEVARLQTGLALGKVNVIDPVKLPYLRVANVQDGYFDLATVKQVEVARSEVERYSLRRGDVLFTEGGDADKLGRGAVWNGEVPNCLHQNHVFAVRVDPAFLLPAYLAAYSASTQGRAYFLGCSKQSTNLASINSSQLKAMPLPLPPLPVQRGIAAILSTWDLAIELTEKLIAAKRQRKAALIQLLLTGKVRLPKFGKVSLDSASLVASLPAPVWRGVYPPSVQPGIPKLGPRPSGWEETTMEKLLQVQKRSVELQDGTVYQLVVARRNRGGIEAREQLLGGEIKTPTQFMVHRGDFVISRRQIIHGACGVVPPSLEGAIVSNEYAVCRVNGKLNIDFLKYLTHTLYFQQTCFHASAGVALEKMIFRLERWLTFPFLIPPVPEQEVIAELLVTADSEIELHEKKLDALRRQKKGLMQQLLTGKVRVKVTEPSGA